MQVHKLLIFNLFCILSISCTPIVEGPERNSLDVNFCIESGSSPAVRSIIPTSNENAVHNVALACYNSSGELVGAMFIDEGNISASISLTYPNNYHIYALGNCSLSEDRLTRQYPREDDIKELEYRIDDYASLDSGGFPMSTSFYLSINENAALSIVNDGSEGSYINDGGIVICLKRLVCRYLFQLDKSELPDDYRYTLTA